MSKKFLAALVAVFALVTAGVVVAGCGDGGDESTANAEQTDGAFIAAMIPHHQSAIEMAKVAQKEGEHPQIKQLADDIIAAQDAEIGQMEQMHQRMFGQPVQGSDHGSLGLDDEMMGMTMDMHSLEGAKPFDRAFIDAMIPHHQGAIRMAQVELAEGQDQETKDLARAIISAQSKEIEEMNRWRQQWYGAPSPAGGVPSTADTDMPSHEMMGH
jgi:uncharacterized protein (DUF305 family)